MNQTLMNHFAQRQCEFEMGLLTNREFRGFKRLYRGLLKNRHKLLLKGNRFDVVL